MSRITEVRLKITPPRAIDVAFSVITQEMIPDKPNLESAVPSPTLENLTKALGVESLGKRQLPT
jgi:hypothetical protein